MKLAEEDARKRREAKRLAQLKLAIALRLRMSVRMRYFLHSRSLVHPSESAWNKLYASKHDGSLLVVCLCVRACLGADI